MTDQESKNDGPSEHRQSAEGHSAEVHSAEVHSDDGQSIDGHLDAETLLRFVRDELDEPANLAAAEHIEACSQCEQQLESLTSVRPTLPQSLMISSHAAPPHMTKEPAMSHDDVSHSRPHKPVYADRAPERSPSFWRPFLLGVVAVFILMGLFGLGVMAIIVAGSSRTQQPLAIVPQTALPAQTPPVPASGDYATDSAGIAIAPLAGGGEMGGMSGYGSDMGMGSSGMAPGGGIGGMGSGMGGVGGLGMGEEAMIGGAGMGPPGGMGSAEPLDRQQLLIQLVREQRRQNQLLQKQLDRNTRLIEVLERLLGDAAEAGSADEAAGVDEALGGEDNAEDSIAPAKVPKVDAVGEAPEQHGEGPAGETKGG